MCSVFTFTCTICIYLLCMYVCIHTEAVGIKYSSTYHDWFQPVNLKNWNDNEWNRIGSCGGVSVTIKRNQWKFVKYSKWQKQDWICLLWKHGFAVSSKSKLHSYLSWFDTTVSMKILLILVLLPVCLMLLICCC